LKKDIGRCPPHKYATSMGTWMPRGEGLGTKIRENMNHWLWGWTTPSPWA